MLQVRTDVTTGYGSDGEERHRRRGSDSGRGTWQSVNGADGAAAADAYARSSSTLNAAAAVIGSESAGGLGERRRREIVQSSSSHTRARDASLQRLYGSSYRDMDAFTRHKKLVEDYERYWGKRAEGSSTQTVKTDEDVLRESYRFVRSVSDNDDSNWEKRLAKKYYSKLFREYALADLSHYKRGDIGLRWRTSGEVMAGKGQFICGNKKCNETQQLASFEINFGYREAGESKQALVKVRLCPPCAAMLHHQKLVAMEAEERRRKMEKEKLKEEQKTRKKRKHSPQKKEKKKRKRSRGSSSDGDTSDSSGDDADDAESKRQRQDDHMITRHDGHSGQRSVAPSASSSSSSQPSQTQSSMSASPLSSSASPPNARRASTPSSQQTRTHIDENEEFRTLFQHMFP